jgi:hypothetical protein
MIDREMEFQQAPTGTAAVTPPTTRRPGLYAWAASILVHVLILAALWFVHFPQDRGHTGDPVVPLAAVTNVQKMTQTAAIIPKPRVRLPSKSVKPRTTTLSGPLLTGRPGENQPDTSTHDHLAPSGPQSYMPDVPADLNDRIEFFGSYSQHRKVCYVVDCSGSMRGLFKSVQSRLRQSISDLQPDQYFHIIFFGDGKLKEFGSARLHRASENNKSAAFDFIDSVRPAGTTNALAALERALKIRDVDGNPPAVVYFLTDGFDLDGKGSTRFAGKTAEIVKQAAAIQINTIGFWPQDEDRTMLEAIAARSGGKCVLITGDMNPADSQD